MTIMELRAELAHLGVGPQAEVVLQNNETGLCYDLTVTTIKGRVVLTSVGNCLWDEHGEVI